MNIQMINVNKIKPDPNQPRKTIDEERIKEMAQSITTEGVINPIEIDENNIIITGEMRWRSAKKAGLIEVPCKRLTLTDDIRFRRQVIENIHHNTMTAWDTAEALKKLQDCPPGGQTDSNDSVRDLALQIGKSKTYVSDMLSMLEESGKVKKYLQSKSSKPSIIREINRTIPTEYQDEIKEKVVQEKINSRSTVLELGKALKRSPDKAEQLLHEDYVGTESDNFRKIQTIAPVLDLVKEMDKGSKVLLAMNSLVEVLNKISPESIPNIDKNRVGVMAEKLMKVLSNYRNNNLIEGEVI